MSTYHSDSDSDSSANENDSDGSRNSDQEIEYQETLEMLQCRLKYYYQKYPQYAEEIVNVMDTTESKSNIKAKLEQIEKDIVVQQKVDHEKDLDELEEIIQRKSLPDFFNEVREAFLKTVDGTGSLGTLGSLAGYGSTASSIRMKYQPIIDKYIQKTIDYITDGRVTEFWTMMSGIHGFAKTWYRKTPPVVN